VIRVLHREGAAFVPVAWVDGIDLGFAYKATQNGVLTDSWSMWPVAGMRPIGQPFHIADGRKVGRRSSMVGDRFESHGKTFVCANTEFAELPPAPTGMTEADLGPEPPVGQTDDPGPDRIWQIWAVKAMAIRFCGLRDAVETIAFHLAMESLIEFAGKPEAATFAGQAFPIGHGARAAADLALDIQTLPVAAK
jgi:hypothetical protein